jgi:surfeit locus 1 family protein
MPGRRCGHVRLPAMYRFALRGKWLVGHIVVLALAALFVRLGIWQLHRLHERRAHNRVVETREAASPEPISRLADPTASSAPEAAYRRAEASGTYDATRQVRVRNRSLDGQPGELVLTPLRLTDGTAVVVARGWVPLVEGGAPLPASVAPPSGPVRVEGLVLAPEKRGSFGPRDPATGTLPYLARVDIARYQRQLPYDVFPVYLELVRQRPPQSGELPKLVPPPELGEGPHFSYAMQWFSFATIGLIGWVALVRKGARDPEPMPEPVGAVASTGPTGEPGDVAAGR